MPTAVAAGAAGADVVNITVDATTNGQPNANTTALEARKAHARKGSWNDVAG